MLMQQVKLEQDTDTGTKVLVAWLSTHTILQKGNTLTLKGETGWWKVIEFFGIKDRQEIHDDWKVGGLS